MGRWVWVLFWLSVLFRREAIAAEAVPAVSLRVYDFAAVPVAARSAASDEVIRIFTKAGVEARWLDCEVGHPSESPCREKLTASDLAVRVVNQRGANSIAHLFGLAVALPSGLGQYATIFYGEIRARANRDEIFEGRVLGYAIAHEVGHLMLGGQSHAPAGIMMAGWTVKDMRSQARDSFRFTDREAEELRANAVVRARAAQIERELVSEGVLP